MVGITSSSSFWHFRNQSSLGASSCTSVGLLGATVATATRTARLIMGGWWKYHEQDILRIQTGIWCYLIPRHISIFWMLAVGRQHWKIESPNFGNMFYLRFPRSVCFSLCCKLKIAASVPMELLFLQALWAQDARESLLNDLRPITC